MVNNTDKVRQLIEVARKAGWTGLITYASLPNEIIYWDQIQDENLVVSCNLYWGWNHEEERPYTDEEYEQALLRLKKNAGNRRVIITEFVRSHKKMLMEKVEAHICLKVN